MLKFVGASLAILAMTATVQAVSVGELVSKCGSDSDKYCKNVGYGDAMTQCLVAHKKDLTEACQAVVERVVNGEKVSLF